MSTELKDMLQFSLVALSSIFFIVDPLAAIPSVAWTLGLLPIRSAADLDHATFLCGKLISFRSAST